MSDTTAPATESIASGSSSSDSSATASLILAGIAPVLLALSGNFLVDDLFGGWGNLSGEPATLIAWKTALFIAVLLLAAL
jgi:hypothetical protein